MEAHHINPATGEDEMALSMSVAERWRATASALPRAALRLPRAQRRGAARNPNDPTSWGKVGRNEVCPCGSGKKFKHCHGRYV